VSLTEIELARARGRSKAPKWQEREAALVDGLRRSSWHNDGAFKLVFNALAMSGFMYPSILEMIAMFFSILSLQVIIFNPIIATRYLDKHYVYLSDNRWEGWWKHRIGETFYHLFFGWLIFVACLSFLTLKRINIL
jgi:hypothetical protein